MIDIHCHFLPGIDDGPDTMAEAVALARVAVADGITHSIVTPHIHPGRWENDVNSIRASVAGFKQALQAEGVPLKISFAAEVRLTDFIFKQLELLHLPFMGTLAGYSLLLLEFPHGHLIPGTNQLTQWLMKKKIRPVLAHPERNKSIMRDPDLLKPLLQTGCLLQVTAGSLTGQFGSKAQKVALQLLEQDHISFVATDAHNIKARPPILSEAHALVSRLKGVQYADRLFAGNQLEFLADSAEVTT